MNALAPISTDVSAIVATIERARALFDDGDVQAAMLLAGGAYEQAKAAAGYAGKVKAARALIDKARRMQADALKIETDCTIRLADEVDAAKNAGELAAHGRPKNVPDGNVFTMEEAGLNRKDVHYARKLRDAERAEPGITERIIEARIEAGLEPSRNSLRAAIGTRSATKEEKGDQLYETSDCAILSLLALESFSATVWEPACGKGAIVRPLEAAGYEVVISDLVDRGTVTQHGECQGVGDFLDTVAGDAGEDGPDIVTNPPYDDLANKFAAHALRVHRPRKMALLLNLNFLAGFDDPDRCYVMDECPPARVYVFTKRLPMMHRDGWDGPKASSSMNTAWFVWERDEDGYTRPGETRVIRINWEHWQRQPALAPVPGLAGRNRFDLASITFETEDDDAPRTTPRLTLEERVALNIDACAAWAVTAGDFDEGQMRRGIGLRVSTARAIIEALWKQDRLVCVTNTDGEKWRWKA